MISIIIPTLNEEEGIAKVICSIPEKIRKKSEVIVVDASTDYTPIIAQRLGAKVIKSHQGGKGRQMRLGVKASKGKTLVFLDGDGQTPPQYIPQLLQELKKAQLVLGSRGMKDFDIDDRHMRRVIKIYCFFITRLFRLIDFKVSGDPLTGFRAIRRKDWDRLGLDSDDFKIEAEMNIKAMKQGLVIKEIPIPHLKRSGGGLLASKVALNPQQWLEISKLFLKYFREEKLASRLRAFESKMKSYVQVKRRT